MRWSTNAPFFWLAAGTMAGLANGLQEPSRRREPVLAVFPAWTRTRGFFAAALVPLVFAFLISSAFWVNQFRSDVLYETAEDMYDACRDIGPGDKRWKGIMGQAEKTNREALRLNPYCFRGYYLAGNILKKTDRPAEALRFYLGLEKMAPGYCYLNAQMGEVLASLADNYGRAGKKEKKQYYLELAADRYGRAYRQNDSAPMFENAILLEAVALTGRGEEEKALAKLDELLSKSPSCVPAWFHRAGVHARAKRWEKALAGYREAIRLDPANELAYKYAGSVCLDWGKPAEAVALLEEGMKKVPASLDIRLVLGKAYLRAGRVDEGLAELKRIMEKAPASFQAREAEAVVRG